MIVRFTKARHEDRPHTLTCIRDDGTTTGQASTGFFVRHDLTHFAVETVLGLDRAFYGLVAGGWDIDAFGEREPGSRKARSLPPQAHLAELTVGALDLDWADPSRSPEDVVAMIAEQVGSDVVIPTTGQIEAIREKRAELLRRWREIEPGHALELTF